MPERYPDHGRRQRAFQESQRRMRSQLGAIPRGAKAVVRGIMDPVALAARGDVPQGMGGAVDYLASMVPGATAFKAAAAPALKGLGLGLAGIMAGPRAMTANPQALLTAHRLRQRGIPDEAIWQETGRRFGQPWWLGHPDRVPRFEISDRDFIYDPDVLPQGMGAFSRGTLRESVEHPELMAAYPDLGDVANIAQWHPGRKRGQYDPGSAVRRESITTWPADLYDETPLDTVALHEIGHAVQRREGMAPGGSLSGARKLQRDEGLWLSLDPSELYTRLGGEMDARAIEARHLMSMADRIRNPFWESYDRPLSKMVIP